MASALTTKIVCSLAYAKRPSPSEKLGFGSRVESCFLNRTNGTSRNEDLLIFPSTSEMSFGSKLQIFNCAVVRITLKYIRIASF